jgi:hypothetical protein
MLLISENYHWILTCPPFSMPHWRNWKEFLWGGGGGQTTTFADSKNCQFVVHTRMQRQYRLRKLDLFTLIWVGGGASEEAGGLGAMPAAHRHWYCLRHRFTATPPRSLLDRRRWHNETNGRRLSVCPRAKVLLCEWRATVELANCQLNMECNTWSVFHLITYVRCWVEPCRLWSTTCFLLKSIS